jgi:hypothetical protein
LWIQGRKECNSLVSKERKAINISWRQTQSRYQAGPYDIIPLPGSQKFLNAQFGKLTIVLKQFEKIKQLHRKLPVLS